MKLVKIVMATAKASESAVPSASFVVPFQCLLLVACEVDAVARNLLCEAQHK